MEIGDIYNFEENKIISKKEENGYERQTFHKEKVTWRVLHKDDDKHKALLISERPTEQKITLCRTSTDIKIQ